MTSLLEKLNGDWEDYTDTGKQKFLNRLLEEYSKSDYYTLMGIDKDKSFDENLPKVKADYKKLALKLHPDRNGEAIYAKSAESLLKLVITAYNTLSDIQKEKIYRVSLPSISTFSHDNAQTTSSKNNTYSKYSNNKPKTTYSFTTRNVFTTFGSTTPKIYDRDIEAHEQISAMNEHICINGNVYGTVSNMNGSNTINGSVFGTVTNLNAPNIIRDNVEKTGTVSNINSSNIVQGDMHGTVRNIMGKNQFNGFVDGEEIRGQSNTQNVQCAQQ